MESSSTSREEGSFSLLDIEHMINSLRESLSRISASSHSMKSCEYKLTDINGWVTEQKRKSKEKSENIPVENVGKALQASINGMKKFKTGKDREIAAGVLEIVASMSDLAGGPNAPHVKALCAVVSAILAYNKPEQASVVDRLAKVVHMKLTNFNTKLQDQKYNGLKRRVSDQMNQLHTLGLGEKLDDPNLWNDFIQFLGELSNRFESPLPFQYSETSLTKDPDVEDFVTALVTYCEAYNCFMALLLVAKGKFEDLGQQYKGNEDTVDRKISCQQKDAREKLAFLSDERYLTFLGRLPCEDGKLIKIVALSRNLSGKGLVEIVRNSLRLPQMPDLAKVESVAAKVAGQSVKLRLQGHHVPPGNLFKWMTSLVFGPPFWTQFINETDFPMKIVSRTKGGRGRLNFTHDVQPHSSCPTGFWGSPFSLTSACGYIVIFLNGEVSRDLEPLAKESRVIEFALSRSVLNICMINIQDNTCSEFTHGEDTNSDMNSGEAKTLYWFERGVHFMAKAEILYHLKTVWRFVIQSFDPLQLQD